MLSSPQHQHDTTSASSSRPTRSSQDKRSDKKTETIPASTPRQPDEIEEADTTVPVKTYQPNPKQKQKRAESSSDKDTDDAESVYLSSDEEDTSDEDSSGYDSDSQVSVEELPPRQLSRRAADRSVKTATGSPFTVTQTRSETTRWVSTQSNGGMVRGARTVNQQTTLHGHNVNGPQRRPGGRNSISFNMSVNVDMSFNGFVTGRNLGFTGVGNLPLVSFPLCLEPNRDVTNNDRDHYHMHGAGATRKGVDVLSFHVDYLTTGDQIIIDNFEFEGGILGARR